MIRGHSVKWGNTNTNKHIVVIISYAETHSYECMGVIGEALQLRAVYNVIHSEIWWLCEIDSLQVL